MDIHSHPLVKTLITRCFIGSYIGVGKGGGGGGPGPPTMFHKNKDI